jgi:hypothetical protein
MKAVKFGFASLPLILLPFVSGAMSYACGGAGGTGFGDGGGTGPGGDGSSSNDGGVTLGDSSHNGDAISLGDSGGSTMDSSGDVIITSVTTVYATTDTALYSLDPKSNAVTLVGNFAGMGDSEYNSITDCAVNAEGQVYVNTESQVFTAALPTSGTVVNLTSVATIATAKDQYFYALAFAPKGFLGTGETLIGGDNIGNLYSIDTSGGGTLKNLGNFGGVPGSTSGEIFALSGDMVFYTDSGKATGLATIRQCEAGGKTCTKTNDYLAGIDMTALQTAYTSGTPAPSLLGGIYGGSSTSIGAGTNYGEIFGLGAWEGNVYGFTNAYTNPTTMAAVPPQLVSISTSTGAGTVIPASFPFTTDGWSGAGVTTTVTITVPPPPPPPPQPH